MKWNPYADIKRSIKATALADKLVQLPGITLDDMGLFDSKEWGMLAQEAGVKPPGKSGKTQALVIAMVKTQRERAR